MAITTALPDAVQWSEGMLLSPQHMQQNDIYWQAQLCDRLAAITPHFWGVRQLKLDPVCLLKGVVSITALDCILPDGLSAVFPGNFLHGASGLSINVINQNAQQGCGTNDGRPIRIWLRVYDRDFAAAKSDNPQRRYNSLAGVQTGDENIGDNQLQVPVNRLQVQMELVALDAGQPGPAGNSVCPLLELTCNAQGHLVINHHYFPPMVCLHAGDFLEEHSLQQQLENLKLALWSKLEELAGGRKDNVSDTGASADALQHLTIARHLAACLPQLDIALSAAAHPLALYRAVAQVVGQVAGIGNNPIPISMQPYRHEDCAPQFQAAFTYIENKLTLARTAYELLRFERLGDGCFGCLLPAHISGEVIIELTLRQGQSVAELVHWLAETTIASAERLPVMQRRRLPGALRHLLSAQEIKERNLPTQGAFFLIENQKIDIEGQGLQDVFIAGHQLLIKGRDDQRMPDAILLHQKKRSRHAKDDASAEDAA